MGVAHDHLQRSMPEQLSDSAQVDSGHNQSTGKVWRLQCHEYASISAAASAVGNQPRDPRRASPLRREGKTVKRSRFGLSPSGTTLSSPRTATLPASTCLLRCATSSDITSRESRRTDFAPFTDSLCSKKLLCFFTGRPPSFGIAPLSALITASLMPAGIRSTFSSHLFDNLS
jgi:hypothetical protein